MTTKNDVLEAQKEWGAGVVKIGSLKNSRSECEAYTSEFLDKLYSGTFTMDNSIPSMHPLSSP